MKRRSGISEPAGPPRSTAGRYFLSFAMGRSTDRARLARELRGSADAVTEIVPVFEASLAVLLDKCFTRAPEATTVERFVETVLSPFADSIRFDQAVAGRFVASVLVGSRFPEDMDREDAIELCAVFAYVIVRRLGLCEKVVRYAIGKAEQLVLSGGQSRAADPAPDRPDGR